MADSKKKKYANPSAVTEAIKAIRRILGNVSSAGIEEVGKFIDGGGQSIVSALFALDSELSKKSSIFRIDIVQVGDSKFIFNRSFDEIKEAYNNGYAIYVEDRAVDRISVDEEYLTISVSDSYTFTAGGSQVYYKTYNWSNTGELTISENTVNLLTYGRGTKFLSDDGNYKEVAPSLEIHIRDLGNQQFTTGDITKADVARAYTEKQNVKLFLHLEYLENPICSTNVSIRPEGDEIYVIGDFFESVADDGWQYIHHLRLQFLEDDYEIYYTQQEVVYHDNALLTGTSVIDFPNDNLTFLDGDKSFSDVGALKVTIEKDTCDTNINIIKEAFNRRIPIFVNNALCVDVSQGSSTTIEVRTVGIDFYGYKQNMLYLINESGGVQETGDSAELATTEDVDKKADKVAVEIADLGGDNSALCTLSTANFGKVYKIQNGALSSLTIRNFEYDAVYNNNEHHEVLIEFDCAQDDMTLTLPSNVSWANDDAPTFNASWHYQLSITRWVDMVNVNTFYQGVCVGFPI